jgi:FKBP-type peptidyl-prolyl cis-trans isomerase SlpA
MAVKKGDSVKVEYEGRFENGEVFDSSSKTGKPLEFEVGSGKVIPGFDNGVIGMEVNEEKEINIEKKDAYGDYREELKKEVPRDALPKEQEPKKGMMLVMSTPEGQQIPARIVDVDDKKVVLDLNHPLAGKDIVFKIKIVEISEGSEDAPSSEKGEDEKKMEINSK